MGWSTAKSTPHSVRLAIDARGGRRYPPSRIGVRRAVLLLFIVVFLAGQTAIASAEQPADPAPTPMLKNAGAPPDVNDEASDPAATQSETTVAVDSTGQHVVVGFNDFRGGA